EEDRVEAHPARARLPEIAFDAPKRRELLPRLRAVRRLKERRVLDAGIDGVGIVVLRLEMPDARELPGLLRAVVELVRPGVADVFELVAHRLPRLAGVIRTLDDLSKPAARLGGVQAVRVRRRALEVVDLPAREVRTRDLPFLALAVGLQNE